MRFHDRVVLFDFCGIPMAGNLDNGFAIGLTSEGASLCERLSSEDVLDDLLGDEDQPLIEAMRSNGFFDDAHVRPSLKSAYFHVTQRCNLRCVGCYSDGPSRNALQDSPTESLKHAISELASCGCKSLFFSGGEPFMRDDLPELVEHAKDSGIGNVTVITNGTCIKAKMLEAMSGYVDAIAVSIDGYSQDTPSHIRRAQRFDDLVESVKLIKDAGIQAHITPTIHSKNLDDLRHYVDLAESLDVTFNYSLLSCKYGDPEIDALLPNDDELESLANNLLGLNSDKARLQAPLGVNLTVSINCGLAAKEVSIDSDGEVYPCHLLQDPSMSLGNVFREPLNDILSKDKAKEISNSGIEDFADCSACEHRYLCGGGCRARSYFRYGNLRSRDGYCAMMKAYFDGLGKMLRSRFGNC